MSVALWRQEIDSRWNLYGKNLEGIFRYLCKREEFVPERFQGNEHLAVMVISVVRFHALLVNFYYE